jgi:hypothetical protein
MKSCGFITTCGQVARIDEIDVNRPVLLFSLLIPLGTGVLFGLLPAIRNNGLAGPQDLHDSGSGAAGGRGGRAVTSGRQTQRRLPQGRATSRSGCSD